MIERRRQRRILEEHQTRLERSLWEEPNRAQVEVDTTSQREDDQLDNNEHGDLQTTTKR